MCMPVWLTGKGLYFLDHWFIIIKAPNTVLCESASGICFSRFIYLRLKSPPALWMLKQTGFHLVPLPPLACQGLSHLLHVQNGWFQWDLHNYLCTVLTAKGTLCQFGSEFCGLPWGRGRDTDPTVSSPHSRHTQTSSLQEAAAAKFLAITGISRRRMEGAMRNT